MKDYYAILGIRRNASDDDIKKAFHKRAHVYHPDKKTGDEKRFKELNEAYQILGNTKKRRTYDEDCANEQSGESSGTARPTNTSQSSHDTQATKTYTTPYSNKAPSQEFVWITHMTRRGLARIARTFVVLAMSVAQVVAGVLIFFLAYGIVAPIINFIIFNVDGVRYWLTQTFLGLFFFSAIMFCLQKYVYPFDFKKIRYIVGGVLLIYFLQHEGIPNATINREMMQEQLARVASSSKSIPFEQTMYEMRKILTKEEVTQLQTWLANDSSVYPSGNVTGSYDEDTHRALIRFQEKYGLRAEGYYGEQTRAKVREVFGK